MSPPAASSSGPSASQWIPRRPSKRSKLRNGTFIIPSTGERSRRQFSLRGSLEPNGPSPHSSDLSATGVGGEALRPLLSSPETFGESVEARYWQTRAALSRFGRWLWTDPKGRGVLKCTVAYLLASLATLWDPLAHGFLGELDGRHIVATISVYFHPARSWGSMVEAVLVAIVAVAYAELVAVGSMAASVLLGSTLGSPPLAYVVVLLLFVGGGLGLVGWVKQRANSALVNVGSTLASLAIISVVTKENAVQTGVFEDEKIVQVLKMLFLGIGTTVAVNLCLWRVAAHDSLRRAMGLASVALADMVALITRGFLYGSEDELTAGSGFDAALKEYQKVYACMMTSLRETKYELYVVGREDLYRHEKTVVCAMETLAQSIGGLRSALNTQSTLLREVPVLSPVLSPMGSPGRPYATGSKSGKDRVPVLSSIDEIVEDEETNGQIGSAHARKHSVERTLPPQTSSVFRSPGEIFELFIASLGPSMKSLAYTLSEILREPTFGQPPKFEIHVNDHFKESLEEALGLYNSARANALEDLYKSIELRRLRSDRIQADIEEVAAACGHFSFSLQTFGEEMVKYLDVLDELKFKSENSRRSWHWLMFWTYWRQPGKIPAADDPEAEVLIKPIKKSRDPKGIPDAMVRQRDRFAWDAAPQSNKVVRSLSEKVLRSMRKLARDDIRFGIKVGIGAVLWAMFAFIPQTRPMYQHWRGEWGLLSFMIVCTITVGSSTTTGFSRLVGNVLGAVVSVVVWNISRGNAVALAFLGWLVSFAGFCVILVSGNAPLGRITLLTYNVSVLYAYSLTQKVPEGDEDEGGLHPLIMEIVQHRVLAVGAGILWGLIICRFVWPISARRKFKEGVSMLFLQMGIVWKRGPLAILLRSDATRSYLRSGEQAAMQRYASRLESLRNAARSEFELRGPFPYESHGRIMASTNRILDAFYAMSLVAQRHRGMRLSPGERALLVATADERAQLCDRICHVFQVLASSIMLEYPLTDALPPILGTRDRLLAKVFGFRKDHAARDAAAAAASALAQKGGAENQQAAVPQDVDIAEGSGSARRSKGDDAAGVTATKPWVPSVQQFQDSDPASVVVEERDYALLYAYALVTGQVATELKKVEKEIESLFGVLDGDVMLLQ